MRGTANTETRPRAVDAEDSRPYFGQSSLDALMAQFNAHPGLLERDWRNTVRATFRLSPEKAMSLVRIDAARIEEIQEFFRRSADHIRRGGTIRGTIIELPVEERTEARAHDVMVEMIRPLDAHSQETMVPVQKIRIAHCDANCRNWQWNSF